MHAYTTYNPKKRLEAQQRAAEIYELARAEADSARRDYWRRKNYAERYAPRPLTDYQIQQAERRKARERARERYEQWEAEIQRTKELKELLKNPPPPKQKKPSTWMEFGPTTTVAEAQYRSKAAIAARKEDAKRRLAQWKAKRFVLPYKKRIWSFSYPKKTIQKQTYTRRTYNPELYLPRFHIYK